MFIHIHNCTLIANMLILCVCFLTAPTAPRSLMIVNVTDSTVTLSWLQPSVPNGIITQYQVQYRRTNGRDHYSNNQVNTMTTNLTYTVTGLKTGTEYNLRVRAFTVVRRGPSSNVVTAFVGKLEYMCKSIWRVVQGPGNYNYVRCFS